MEEQKPDDLQFETAETLPGLISGARSCASCQVPITGFYYEAMGKVFCSSCANQLKQHLASGGGASFARAAVFGAAGALAGAAIYYGVAAAGFELGLIAILVGYLVGKGIRKGAGVAGGREYQVMAVVMTYVAVGSAYTALLVRGGYFRRDLVQLLILTLKMPVLYVMSSMPGGVISAFIIGIALRQAWVMNTPVNIAFTGPFKVGGAATPA